MERELKVDVCLRFPDMPIGKYMYLADFLEDYEKAKAKLKEVKEIIQAGKESFQEILDNPLEENKTLLISDCIHNDNILLKILDSDLWETEHPDTKKLRNIKDAMTDYVKYLKNEKNLPSTTRLEQSVGDAIIYKISEFIDIIDQGVKDEEV